VVSFLLVFPPITYTHSSSPPFVLKEHFSKLMLIRRYFIPYKILDATKYGLYKTQNKKTL
jgi:hypothetical protein